MHRVACALLPAVAVDAAGWVYADSGQAAADRAAQDRTWGGLCITGREQSPINVVTADAVQSSAPVIETHFDTTAHYVKNTGHGFQLFETSPASHKLTDGQVSEVDSIGGAKGYSMIGGAKYNFYQVHWHAPSENTVDGKLAAAEAHFVHQLDDDALHGSLHRLAVIGLMYDLGTDQECNPFLDKFWNSFPEQAGTAAYSGENLDFNAKLTDELAKGYWHWYGSLTTPPCTEGVSWNLLKVREKICQRQLDKLTAALSATQSGIGFNNRFVQPLNHRVVVEMTEGASHRPVNKLPTASTASQWLYAQQGENSANETAQDETWGGLCVTGHEQSPIDIVTSAVKRTNTASIVTHFDTQAKYVKNTGHGFQLFETALEEDIVGVDGISAKATKGYSMIHNDKFNFYQVHWHTPSENTVDGKHTIMEAHFVHQLDDAAVVGTYHRLAVVGLMYELGTDAECNTWLDQFWDIFPVDAKGKAAYDGSNPDLNKKLTDEIGEGYYHWYGSLTTPPCTEGVSWNLLKRREKVCQRQVDRLMTALGNSQSGIDFNNRAVQPLNHRIVVETDQVTRAQTDGATVSSVSGAVLFSLLLAQLR